MSVIANVESPRGPAPDAVRRPSALGPPMLVVLARAPELEQVKTRFGRTVGAAVALDVYRQLLVVTAHAARSWPGPVQIHATGSSVALAGSAFVGMTILPQCGQTLAQRLAAALSSGLDAAGSVIAIGTDCPGVRPRHLRQLAALSAQAPVVFGPAADGGYWGIAVSDARALPLCCAEDLPWSQPQLLRASQQLLTDAGIAWRLGDRLDDLDEQADWRRAIGAGLLPPLRPTISVVIPVRNEARSIGQCLDRVQAMAGAAEVLVVDGESSDGTAALAAAHPMRPRVLRVAGGRHRQLNAAARVAGGDYLMLLPVDARLGALGLLHMQLWLGRRRPLAAYLPRAAHSQGPLHRYLAGWASIRSQWSGGAYLDQVPVVHRKSMLAVGGARNDGPYDTAMLVRRLAGWGGLQRAPVAAVVSIRAYLRHGALALTLRHQWCRWRHHWRRSSPRDSTLGPCAVPLGP